MVEQPQFSDLEKIACEFLKKDPSIKARMFIQVIDGRVLVGLSESLKAVKGFFFWEDRMRLASALELKELSMILAGKITKQ